MDTGAEVLEVNKLKALLETLKSGSYDYSNAKRHLDLLLTRGGPLFYPDDVWKNDARDAGFGMILICMALPLVFILSRSFTFEHATGMTNILWSTRNGRKNCTNKTACICNHRCILDDEFVLGQCADTIIIL